jgi:endophilin-A
METLRKFRTQVAKHAPKFGPQASSDVIIDELELERFHRLEKLYASTRAGKHFQRDVTRGVEGMVSTGTKQLEVATKLAEECRKYGMEGPGVGSALARAAMQYGAARSQMERERDNMNRIFGTQVADPLRAMVTGAPLEDARQLTNRYKALRQDAEVQATEVGKRMARNKETGSNPENTLKLQMAEQKLGELSASMAVLGNEAAAAMTAVETQQQRLTLQRLTTMVEAEHSYHQRVAEILDELLAQMVSERQRTESAIPNSNPTPAFVAIPSYEKNVKPSNGHQTDEDAAKAAAVATKKASYYLAEVIHSFEGEGQGELSLNLGDYVVVRQVSPTGWSEGECKGKAGWFPSTYVEQREHIPSSKVVVNDSPM